MKTLISVIGPTGIGKTRLAIEIAKHFSTEILSCDARQFFREMPIGTAAPTAEELAEVPHHFIANRSVTEDYSLGQFETDALQKLTGLYKKHNVAVMVGGSSMYEKAVVEGLNDLPEANAENQHKLTEILKNDGLEGLQNLLGDLDPEYFKVVHKENPRRLLRAIDVIWQTGEKYSSLIATPSDARDFHTIRIQIQASREIIYGRINQRVDKMIESGLLEEARNLLPFKQHTALQTVGYTELFNYFEGAWPLDFAIEEIKKNSRRYAKRQLTWNRKLQNVHWLPLGYSNQELISLLTEFNLQAK